MSSNLKVNTILPSTGTTVAVSGIVSATSSVSIGSSCTATTFYGSGANLTSLPSQVTITGNADNRVITGGSGTNLNGEANVQIDSSGNLLIGTTTAVRALTIKQPGQIHLESTDTGNWLGIQLKGSSGTNNYNAYFGMLDSNGNFFIDNGSNGNDFVISQSGVVTIGGEVHIGSKLVHDGDTDTHINFSSNTIVTTAGNVTKMNVNTLWLKLMVLCRDRVADNIRPHLLVLGQQYFLFLMLVRMVFLLNVQFRKIIIQRCIKLVVLLLGTVVILPVMMLETQIMHTLQI